MADDDMAKVKLGEVDNIPRKDVLAYFDTDHLDLALNTQSYLVARLRGGQAVLIKALVGNTGNIYVGKQDVTSSNGFELAPGESLKIEYSPDKVVAEHIDLYAIPATAGDDVCFIIIP